MNEKQAGLIIIIDDVFKRIWISPNGPMAAGDTNPKQLHLSPELQWNFCGQLPNQEGSAGLQTSRINI
jgi:hypothetical protein